MCPNCGVYLIENEEICPSCGHVIIEESKKLDLHVAEDVPDVKAVKNDYSGVPLSKRVISTPSIGKARIGIRLMFLILFFIPIVNIIAAIYGTVSSKDIFIRRTSQVFLLFFFVILIILGIYSYQYGVGFVVDYILSFIIK
jgi:hypothetical protein